MGTRGLYGFHKNGIDKLTYNHLDSYPDWLGKKIVEFCKCAGRDGMNSLFDHIELVSEDAKPTPKQIEYCMEHDLGVDGGDWGWTLCPNQGCPENWLPFIDSGLKIYMIDSLPFIKDSLFCEYAYIVNLDTDQLEFYCGFQHKPDETNRYGCEEDQGYYPCRMVACFSLDVIAHGTVEEIVKQMNRADHQDDEEA